VEIARALGAESRVLIMDEPTASLSDEDARHLFDVISKLKGRGTGIIYVSHRLEELSRIADRVTILRDGRDVATRPMAELDRNELIRLMVGRELSAIYPKGSSQPGDVAFELRDLCCAAMGVRNVSLTVRSGEIVGLAGLVGAGRTELARTLFGLNRADSGEILVRGRLVTIGNPADAISSGIAYLPEDRSRHGVIGQMSVGANITLAVLKRLSRFGRMDFGEESRLALEYSRRLRIRTPAVFSAVSSLSGGNQQKVALSRWLAVEPAVLILDEPTQGIDVGARAEIHQLISDLAAGGAAILMISSDLPEVLGMSDRIAVMRGGAIAGTFDREEATQEKILSLALADEGSNRAR
jgi:rhamnose transport system ATP-binding protein